VPVVGIVPYLDDLVLAEEDAASIVQRPRPNACVEIAVVHLPHLANFDEFGLLAAEPGVALRYVTRAEELRAPDLVILPGSKATIPDLVWLRERGLAERICWLWAHATPILGICGGYQMLGREVRDPLHIESAHDRAGGLGFFPIATQLGETKHLKRALGRCRTDLTGFWAALNDIPVEGYEIHTGNSIGSRSGAAFLQLTDGPDGSVTADGLVAGTYLHGMFEHPAPRQALLQMLFAGRGFTWSPPSSAAADPYDTLANVLATSLHQDTIAKYLPT
jgi:adenosylcobyric acid synthase